MGWEWVVVAEDCPGLLGCCETGHFYRILSREGTVGFNHAGCSVENDL